MDIAGAKTLKRRLDPSRADEAPGLSGDDPDGTLPVYRWLGIRPPAAETSREPEAERGARST